MIKIIDYGVGNIKAFVNVYHRLGIPVERAKTTSELEGATKIILPGVGAFDDTMQRFNNSGMRETVEDLVLNKKLPVVGICVGMQMLAQSSDEGVVPGLGWIDGTVHRFDVSNLSHKTKLPHMGWNNIVPMPNVPLFKNFEGEPIFYFLHSYYFKCTNQNVIAATAFYGTEYTCAVKHENIYGVQFHPEKSHSYGVQLLKNFALFA